MEPQYPCGGLLSRQLGGEAESAEDPKPVSRGTEAGQDRFAILHFQTSPIIIGPGRVGSVSKEHDGGQNTSGDQAQ